jgi:Uma2 family endonuclease
MPTVLASGRDVLTTLHINTGGLDLYLDMVKGRSGNPRIKCDKGRLLLVSPGSPHEGAAVRLDAMLREVFDVFDVPTRACASTLFRPGRADWGVEPDKSYYIQNFARVRALEEIDLAACPPPDLVLEVVDSHSPALALGVCRKLRVPEVWVYHVRSRRLTMRVLVDDGAGPVRYALTDRSAALPFLRSEDVAPWGAFRDEDDSTFRRRARAWAVAEIAPRRRALDGV